MSDKYVVLLGAGFEEVPDFISWRRNICFAC